MKETDLAPDYIKKGVDQPSYQGIAELIVTKGVPVGLFICNNIDWKTLEVKFLSYFI